MRNDKIQKIVWAGLFIALTAVATMIRLPVPLSNGYVNAGDAVVIVSAFLLGPGWGAIAAGLGAALADIFSGFAIYAPATLIIKALMGLAAGAILRKFKDKSPVLPAVMGSISAAVIMVLGYFAYEVMLYGLGGAAADLVPNSIQGAFGVIAGTVLFYALLRIPYVKKTF